MSILFVFFCFFFFFSSRRRHTRWTGDWSSDVCSSDLPDLEQRWAVDVLDLKPDVLSVLVGVNDFWHKLTHGYTGTVERSEERRVGKECRSRWSPDHEKKKVR